MVLVPEVGLSLLFRRRPNVHSEIFSTPMPFTGERSGSAQWENPRPEQSRALDEGQMLSGDLRA